MTGFDREVDACGLNCPLPVIRAKKTLARMSPGEVLRVVATDPGSVQDFEDLAVQLGCELMESREEAGRYYYRLRKP